MCKRQIEDGLKKVHSAEPSGSAVIEEKILQRVTASVEVIGHSAK